MKELKLYIKEFILAVMAGVCIAIGGVAYLSAQNAIVGSLFFTVGLFIILTLKYNLFTGKVCYSLGQKPSYIFLLWVIWVGNFVGASITGMILQSTKLISLQQACTIIVEAKINAGFISAFLLGIFCNFLICLAVMGFNKFEQPIFKVLALFFGVSVFVLCGFEHCVANMFYFAFASMITGKTMLLLIVTTLGNIVGGLIIPVVEKITQKLSDK